MHELVTAVIIGLIFGGVGGAVLTNYFLHRIGAASNVATATDQALHQKVDQLQQTVINTANQVAQHTTQQVQAAVKTLSEGVAVK